MNPSPRTRKRLGAAGDHSLRAGRRLGEAAADAGRGAPAAASLVLRAAKLGIRTAKTAATAPLWVPAEALRRIRGDQDSDTEGDDRRRLDTVQDTARDVAVDVGAAAGHAARAAVEATEAARSTTTRTSAAARRRRQDLSEAVSDAGTTAADVVESAGSAVADVTEGAGTRTADTVEESASTVADAAEDAGATAGAAVDEGSTTIAEAAGARTDADADGQSAGDTPATPRDLSDLTVLELRERARELDIEGRSGMSKSELVRAIRRQEAVEARAASGTYYADLTVEELRDLATQRGISGRSSMNKKDLVAALRSSS